MVTHYGFKETSTWSEFVGQQVVTCLSCGHQWSAGYYQRVHEGGRVASWGFYGVEEPHHAVECADQLAIEISPMGLIDMASTVVDPPIKRVLRRDGTVFEWDSLRKVGRILEDVRTP